MCVVVSANGQVITGPLAVRKAEEERPEAKAVITIIKAKTTPEEQAAAIIKAWSALPKVMPCVMII